MGLLDSIARSVLNKAIGDVVDKAIDNAFEGNSNQQNQTVQPTTSRIIKPNLTGTVIDESICSKSDWSEYHLKFEKTDKMYETTSDAAEIPISYVIADSEDQAYEDELALNLPEIYIGDDELATPNSGMLKGATNLVVTDVLENGLIKKKYEFDRKSELDGKQNHYIAYKFFVNQKDGAEGIYTVLTLKLPITCSQETKMYAIQSLNLMACTMVIE
ncbi:MAG: hypothetical protein J1E85_04375 [Ruminococcus sp.]|nr:hypothetical protein [Ruminococcus sp.]